MAEILNGYWLEIIFGLISALIFWVIHYLQGEVKKYRKLLENQEHDVLENIINSKLEPINDSLRGINEQIGIIKTQSIKYYATLLQHDCNMYLKRGSVTNKEFEKTSELLHIYEGFGGDGKIHDLWVRVQQLPLQD